MKGEPEQMKIEKLNNDSSMTTYGVYKNNLQPVGVIEASKDGINVYALTNTTSRDEIKKAFYKYMSVA